MKQLKNILEGFFSTSGAGLDSAFNTIKEEVDNLVETIEYLLDIDNIKIWSKNSCLKR